jgi:O-methyltransferase involved in polyketide biosynthesis
LLIYLPPEAQDRLLDNITALSAPGSRLATEHMDMRALPADWAHKLTERAKQLGSQIDLVDLFYTGEREAAGDYLRDRGWQVEILSTEDAYAAQGFTIPHSELTTMMGGGGYLSATLG